MGEAFRVAGVEAAEDQKWCFATDGALKCGLDTICNPSGVSGGTDSAAICGDATKSVPHGAEATEELIYCYGNTGNAALATDDSQTGWLCDQGKGEFIDPKTKMAPRSQKPTETPAPDEKAVEVCFGKDKAEICDPGAYCNSMGTETGCTETACTIKNICVTAESVLEEQESFSDTKKSICINDDATKGEDCNDKNPYCDRANGACTASEVTTTTEAPGAGGGADTSGCTAQSLAAAAVVAILSA